MRPLIGQIRAAADPEPLSGSALLLAADVAVRLIPSTSDIKVAC